MKLRWKIVFIAVIIILFFVFVNYMNRPIYYAMGGNAAVIGKDTDNEGYYIIIDQSLDLAEESNEIDGIFTLECSKEQYDSVEIGDIIDCHRYQNAATQKGYIKDFKKIN